MSSRSNKGIQIFKKLSLSDVYKTDLSIQLYTRRISRPVNQTTDQTRCQYQRPCVGLKCHYDRKTGRFEEMLHFDSSHPIVTRGSRVTRALPHQILPALLNFYGTKNIKFSFLHTWMKIFEPFLILSMIQKR